MDRAEIEGWGLTVRHLLNFLYRESSLKRTALVDGEVAAVWGTQGSMVSEDAQPWLFTTPAVERARMAFFRETRREVAEMLRTRKRLRSYTLASYEQSIRFFTALGFTFGPPEPVGKGGTLYRLMTLERPKPDQSPVMIYALPRSRTKWLSAFLSYGDWEGWHEPGQRFRTTEDVRSWMAQDCTVTADTSAAPWWRLIRETRPDAKVLVVRRPVAEVVDSLMALDMRGVVTFDRKTLTRAIKRMDRKLDQIERRVPNVLSVRFDDLREEATCARVFEHCLPYAHDPDWWQRMTVANLQCDLPSLMRYQDKHKPQIARLTAACREESLCMIRRGRLKSRVGLRRDITIQPETFDVFWRDGQVLFAAHAAEVGPREGAILNPNIPMALSLERAGLVQILTARHGLKMVGYLVMLISPSLEDAALVSGIQNTFYVSPEFRGIGPRMESTALQMLAGRGIKEAVFKAGIRGDGPRLGAMFERLGAREAGRLYTMTLKAA